MAFIAPPDGWNRITDAGELLAFSKQLKLTPKTFTEPKPLIYTGVFTKEPVPCRLVGYVDKHFVVIEVAGQLHTIHPDHLLEMQSTPEAREKRAQTGFFDNIDDFLWEDAEDYIDEDDPFEVPNIVDNPDFHTYTVIDIETSGLSRQHAEVIDLGALRVENGIITDTFSQLVQPSEPVSLEITDLTGITNEMLDGQPSICEVLPAFRDFIGDTILVGQNLLNFDIPILNRCCIGNAVLHIENPCCDTLPLARQCLDLPDYKLGTIAEALGIEQENAHRALADCETTYACFEKLRQMNSQSLELQYPNLPDSDSLSSISPMPAAMHKPKISQQQFMHFKSRPKAKDIHPTSDLFDPAHPLYDMTCVITGELQQISDRDAMQRIADCGGHNADNVTRKTDLLIVGSGSDPEKKSGKVKKAEEYIAKGLPIRIITEEQFLAMLDVSSEPPVNSESMLPIETAVVEELSSDQATEADRIFHEMRAALATAQENYDSEKIQLNLRKPEKAAAYHAIELFGQSCLNFKGSKTLYAEISPKIDALFAAEHIVLDDSRANAWARIPAQELSFADHPQLVIEIYEKYLMTNGFDCCSRYLECSEAERCTHPDIMVAGQCTYRQRLRAGQIFYGSKRNV